MGMVKNMHKTGEEVLHGSMLDTMDGILNDILGAECRIDDACPES